MMITSGVFRFITGLFIYVVNVLGESKLYYGQRIFTDVDTVSFADPSKHGFHIILEEDFVKSYLQPVHLPTVYASAISLTPRSEELKNKTTVQNEPPTRVTKILYPEKGDPENGLLDGRTIKLQGLRERTWYYVCVEFESNVNRHELATGTSCKLRRTLDKFGKSVDSTVSEIELIAVTDRSIAVQLLVDVDFPIRIHTYLTGNVPTVTPTADVPTQTFVVRKSQILNIDFGPFLQQDTVYGKLCILEEPLPSGNSYTAMGRTINANLEHCYFENLKTKPSESKGKYREKGGHTAQHQVRHVGERAARPIGGGAASTVNRGTVTVLIYLSCVKLFL